MLNEMILSGTVCMKSAWSSAVEYLIRYSSDNTVPPLKCISDDATYRIGDTVLLQGQLMYLYGCFVLFTDVIHRVSSASYNSVRLVGKRVGEDEERKEILLRVDSARQINAIPENLLRIQLWDSVFEIYQTRKEEVELIGIAGSFDHDKVKAERVSFLSVQNEEENTQVS